MRRVAFALLVFIGCKDEGPTETAFELRPTIGEVTARSLEQVESCPVYQEERCVQGELQRCDIYDAATDGFVDTPDPLLERVYLYDRWYDKYSSPLGLTMERFFTGAMPGDTPESEWGSPANFDRYVGKGDAAIWTGSALVADIYRYASTRTESDYQRMEDKARTLVRNFEVTGIPGYLSRYHFLQVPPGTPQNDQLILNPVADEDVRPIWLPIENPESIEGLPAEYTDGSGTPRWDGDVSIDQYTGPMTAFPIVYDLLRDEELKQRMVYHLTCYLNRLQRIEIVNLRARPDLIEELQGFFGGSGLKLDPDDPQINELTEMVWYVHAGVNVNNAGTFDKSCPDEPQLTPTRVLDARDATFETDLLELATDLNRDIRTRQRQIDHFYIVSLRGGDASHLMHLAAIAYYLTGEEKYRRFLFDELIENLRTNDVARTMMAFRLPDYCFRFYGDHITYQTHWQFLTMLPEGPLRDEMARVMEEEAWQKGLYNHDNAKFNVMYATVLDDRFATARTEAIATAVSQLENLGGNGGTFVAPRRTHIRDRQAIIDALPAGVEIRCPTEEERATCERTGTVLGFELEGDTISYECDGRPGECVMADGMCAEALATSGLPTPLRAYGDFMWQRSPFQIGDGFTVDGQKQSPGRDLAEPFWMARYYGFSEAGADHVLAWRPSGTCE